MSTTLYKCNIYDGNTINSSIDDLRSNIKNNYKINLIADKGYILKRKNKKILKRNKNTRLITPYRKNQKKTNTDTEKKLLNERYKVENIFMYLKKFKRINIRYDSTIQSYHNFIYLALISTFYNKILTLKI